MSDQDLSILFDRNPAADATQLHIPMNVYVLLNLDLMVTRSYEIG